MPLFPEKEACLIKKDYPPKLHIVTIFTGIIEQAVAWDDITQRFQKKWHYEHE